MGKARSAGIALVLLHWAWETRDKRAANYRAAVIDAKMRLIRARKREICRCWGTTSKGTS